MVSRRSGSMRLSRLRHRRIFGRFGSWNGLDSTETATGISTIRQFRKSIRFDGMSFTEKGGRTALQNSTDPATVMEDGHKNDRLGTYVSTSRTWQLDQGTS